MRRLISAGWVLSLAGLLSCNDSEPARQVGKAPLYFDVKGLVEQQMKLLDQARRPVVKQVTLRDGQQETVRVPSVKWANELQVFLQADINKAALRGAYQVDSTIEGGQVRRSYSRKLELPNAPVNQLTVVQQGREPQEVSAVISQSNALFASKKLIHMKFQGGQLKQYEVRGTQKLILFDTLRYSTAATVE